MATMKVMEISGGFGLDKLNSSERERPEPGPRQLLLKMKAASINYRDLLMVKGAYDPRQALPLIPCSDGVGEVVAVGPGVTQAQVGERVVPIFAAGWISGPPTRERLRSTLGGPLDGVLAEYMTVYERSVVKVPQHLTDAEAATLPCAAVTAWTALVEEGSVTAGDTVLVQGSGGVSVFALQIARVLGAEVIALSSSDEKLERLRELGACHVINYKQTPRWGKKVKQLTGGVGVDCALDVGGAETLAESLDAVRVGGRVALIGVLSGVSAPLNILPIVMGYVRVQGLLVGNREGFERLCRAVAAHELRPVVDSVFPLEETRQALERMERREHFGKICIEIGS